MIVHVEACFGSISFKYHISENVLYLEKVAKHNVQYCFEMQIWGIVVVHTLLYLQEAPLAHQKEKFETPSPKESFGGYECKFVEPPTSAFKTKCPVCRLILREPHLVSCCGTSFCHTCIQRLQADNSPCPTCRKDSFQLFPNKGLERSLKQLQVYCTHRKDCQWTAELGELDQHKECPLTMESKEEAGEGKARHEASFPTHFSVRSAVANC